MSKYYQIFQCMIKSQTIEEMKQINPQWSDQDIAGAMEIIILNWNAFVERLRTDIV